MMQKNKTTVEHDSANRRPLCVHKEHGASLRNTQQNLPFLEIIDGVFLLSEHIYNMHICGVFGVKTIILQQHIQQNPFCGDKNCIRDTTKYNKGYLWIVIFLFISSDYSIINFFHVILNLKKIEEKTTKSFYKPKNKDL